MRAVSLVGVSCADVCNAVLWQDGKMYRLQDLISGGTADHLWSARGINAAGQITGRLIDHPLCLVFSGSMPACSSCLDHGATLPPQEVDDIFRRLVLRGLAAELGLRPARGRIAKA